jgi:hypothetical protein
MSESKEMFYRNHYDSWKIEGGAIKSYCSRNNIVPSSFTYWKQKFDLTEQGPKFKEVRVEKKTAEVMQILKPNGTEINLPLNCPVNLLQHIIQC